MILMLAEVTADQDGQTGCGTSVSAGHARTGLSRAALRTRENRLSTSCLPIAKPGMVC